MNSNHSIAVASSDELKLRAVRQAMHGTRAQRWEIFHQSIKIQTGLPQHGIEQAMAKAAMLASALAEHFPHSICIAIVNGTAPICGRCFDLAAVAVWTPNDALILTQTPLFEIPAELYRELQTMGQDQMSWGVLAHQIHGGDPVDPYKIVTGGRYSILDAYTMGVKSALAQIPWEKYPSSPPQPSAPPVT